MPSVRSRGTFSDLEVGGNSSSSSDNQRRERSKWRNSRGLRILRLLMPRSLFNTNGGGDGEDENALGESMFRSSPMALIQLYIPMEAAQVVTMRAGDLGLVQFRDVHFSNLKYMYLIW